MMNVDAMRKIDRRLGVPICFLLGIFYKLANLFKPARQPQPVVRRTLFVELSEMGSAVIVDPAMRKLQREAGAELFFVIFKDNAKSLEILQTVPDENIFKMNAGNLWELGIDILRFMRWTRKQKITCVIDLELFSRFTAILCYLSGARYRVGFASYHDEGLYRGNMINYPVRYNGHVHIAVNFVSLVNRALGKFDNPYATVPLKAGDLELQKAVVSHEQLHIIKSKIDGLFPGFSGEKIVLFNVNASDMLPQRRWPQENFAAVAKELLVQFDDILVIATGGPSERQYVQDVVDMIDHPRCVNSAGVFKFSELVPLYAFSTFMLTNDSGPAHFAAVTPLKVFVLFGPETPALYLSLGNAEPFYLGLPCSPCVSAANHRKTTCLPRPCITGIKPGLITTRLSQYLNELQLADTLR